jgi:hypothetical protein
MGKLTRSVSAKKIGWTDALPVKGGEQVWVTNRGGPQGSIGDASVIVEYLREDAYNPHPTGWKRLFHKDFTAATQNVGGCDLTENDVLNAMTHFVPAGAKYIRLRADAVQNSLDLTVNPAILHVVYPDASKAPVMRKYGPLQTDVPADETFDNVSCQPSAAESVIGINPGLDSGPVAQSYGLSALPQYLWPGYWATELGASPLDFGRAVPNGVDGTPGVWFEGASRPAKGTGPARQIASSKISPDTYSRDDSTAIYDLFMNPTAGFGLSCCFWYKPYARESEDLAGTSIFHTILQDTDRGATSHINVEIDDVGAITLRCRDAAHTADAEIISPAPTTHNYSTGWKEDTWYFYAISVSTSAHDIRVYNFHDDVTESLIDATPNNKASSAPGFAYADVTDLRYGGVNDLGTGEEQAVGAISHFFLYSSHVDFSATSVLDAYRGGQGVWPKGLQWPIAWDGTAADQNARLPNLYFPDGDPYHNMASGAGMGWHLSGGVRRRKVPGPAQEVGFNYFAS